MGKSGGAREPGWASPSARGSSRPTGAASGLRARARDGARDSPSPFPVAEVEEAASAAGAAREATARAIHPRAGKRTRVLAVDDEPQLLRFLRGVLTDAGYTSFGTGDPTEIFPLLEAEDPHIVLLDLVLPGTTGFDVLKRIREVSEVPVIFLSAHDRDDEIVKGSQPGRRRLHGQALLPRPSCWQGSRRHCAGGQCPVRPRVASPIGQAT